MDIVKFANFYINKILPFQKKYGINFLQPIDCRLLFEAYSENVLSNQTLKELLNEYATKKYYETYQQATTRS